MLSGVESKNATTLPSCAILPCLIAVILCITITALLLPNVFWFHQLWVGAAVGVPLGAVCAYAVQCRIKVNRESMSAMAVSLMLLGHALFELVPDMISQERQLRSVRMISERGIASVVLKGSNQVIRIDNNDMTERLEGCIKRSVLFYPSHEAYVTEFIMEVELSDGEIVHYRGGILERHRQDICLDFKGYLGWHNILLPGAGKVVELRTP